MARAKAQTGRTAKPGARRKTASRAKTRARAKTKAHAKAKAAKSKSAKSKSKAKPRKWSAKVAQSSDALDIEHGAFALKDPARIAASLKRSADRSHRRKAGPFQSAMSMLNFYINRAGKNLSANRRNTLEHAKDELRRLYGRG
jgi:hypothetical protein